MIVKNYTKVKRREKKFYSLFDATVSSSGLVLSTVYTCLALLALFSVFGLAFCWVTGTFWYNPISIAESSSAGYFYMVFVFAPIGLGTALNSIKVQNYKAIDYLKIYITPKVPLDQDGRRIKLTGYHQDTFVERI